MATPTERSILSNLVTTLQAINGTGSYRNTVATVSLTAQDWATAMQTGAYPWVGMMPGRSESKPVYSNTYDVKLPVTLIAHLSAASDTSAYDKYEDMVDDIIAALHADSTRGGNARSTTIDSWIADAGDPDKLAGSQGGTVTLIVELSIRYDRTTSSS